MFADMLIEFVYLCLRIMYNIVKYSALVIIKLVKYIKRQLRKRKVKKQLNVKCMDIVKKDGRFVIEFRGGFENEITRK
jgi:hypothetical protein